MTDATGAILLAGGRASRVDGAAKPLFDVGGRSLLQRAVDALAGCAPVTIVADPVALEGDAHVRFVREEPVFAGPAAAVAAALGSWRDEVADPEWTFVLACDLPGVAAATARLRRDRALLPADTDGLCLADPGSRPQWLTGLYRTAALRRGAAALPHGGRDASLRDLLADLAIAVVAAPAHETDDVDTWDDLERARRAYEE
jgi:molybdopterin-guanine dinucleotide biosynthesis protein A